ncbi:YqgE/AlgH family protein [Sneathiella glossodoripedis]|uniref:YqgE/AlgH family protein n=1 Tax=Sneathiella glossodoripedis TaxID=418853 RepID=UPI0005699A8D|nr:YqgE/AlgH family protein [Sneathiella glossodoripedis]
MGNNNNDVNNGYLEGQILIAMPTMPDPRFQKAIILLCAHGEDGAMGIVLNKDLDAISFEDLFAQLEIPLTADFTDKKIHFGGPVESERGFLLHSTDIIHETSILIDKEIALTATVDMLKSLASGSGPENTLLALGYAGWGPGQLEKEIQENGWLVVDADSDLVFGNRSSIKWQTAIRKLGVDPGALSGDIGHA